MPRSATKEQLRKLYNFRVFSPSCSNCNIFKTFLAMDFLNLTPSVAMIPAPKWMLHSAPYQIKQKHDQAFKNNLVFSCSNHVNEMETLKPGWWHNPLLTPQFVSPFPSPSSTEYRTRITQPDTTVQHLQPKLEGSWRIKCTTMEE